MVVVYNKKTGGIKYTIDSVLDPYFIKLKEDEGVLISEIEYKGKAKNMIVSLPELILVNKTKHERREMTNV